MSRAQAKVYYRYSLYDHDMSAVTEGIADRLLVRLEAVRADRQRPGRDGEVLDRVWLRTTGGWRLSWKGDHGTPYGGERDIGALVAIILRATTALKPC